MVMECRSAGGSDSKEGEEKGAGSEQCEETINGYKQANKVAKRAVIKAKGATFEDLYTSLEGKEGQQKAIRIARQKNREAQDVYQVQKIQGSDGRILSDGEEVKERWMSYFEELLNMENKRDRCIVEPGKEVQVASIERQEVERVK